MAFFPQVSSLYAESKKARFNERLSLALRITLFISLPLTALLTSLATPITRILFERGAFDPVASAVTSDILRILLLGVPFMAILSLQRITFYATGDTRTPFIFQVLSAVMYFVLSISMYRFLGAQGLALSLTISSLILAVLLIVIVARRFLFIERSLMLFSLKLLVASLILVAITSVGLHLFATMQFLRAGKVEILLSAILSGGLGAFGFILILKLLELDEFESLVNIFQAWVQTKG
jgi:putative peptidoglycan lipid II flippase